MSETEVAERIDVSFPITGTAIPRDHGYALFSAISRQLGEPVHGGKWLAIHPVRGVPRDDGFLRVLERASAVTLRLPPGELPKVLSLGGRALDVAGHRILLETPRVYAIKPAPTLASRLVVIKGFTESEQFLEALRRQLDALGVTSDVDLAKRRPRDGAEQGDVWRRVLRIAGKTVVGFGVRLRALDEGGSLKVQYAGLGGRQRFGCGVFIPQRESE